MSLTYLSIRAHGAESKQASKKANRNLTEELHFQYTVQ